MACDPLLHAPAAGIVGSKRQDVVPAILLDDAAKLGSANLQIIRAVVLQALDVVLAAEAFARIPTGRRRDLHQAHRLGSRPIGRVECALLANDGKHERAVDARPDG